MTAPLVDRLEIGVDCVVFDLEKLWEQRQKAIDDEEKSLREWKNLDDEQRAVVEDLICQAMEKMKQDLSWVPYSLEIQQGSCVDIRVRMLFSDISEEVIRRRAVERARLLEAKDGTQQMVTELSARQEERGVEEEDEIAASS